MIQMFRMQREHNVKVHPEWDRQGYEFYRAIWVECAELLDHFGWKWWKKQQPDLAQVKLEIVDIWHFALSDLMVEGATASELAPFFIPKREAGESLGFRDSVERLAALAMRQEFHVKAFVDVIESLPMSFGELYSLYRGKNVLNHFRQDHGYKSGEYRKIWFDAEDNVYLVEALESIRSDSPNFEGELYQSLESAYETAGPQTSSASPHG